MKDLYRMRMILGYLLCLILIVLTFPSIAAAEEESNNKAASSASSEWTKNWEFNFEKTIGVQKNALIPFYAGLDGTIYFSSNTPVENPNIDVMAVTKDGTLKWKNTYPKNNLRIYYNVDNKGNYYMGYLSGNKLTLQKIGPDGKDKSKYTLPGTYVPSNLMGNLNAPQFSIHYNDDGTLSLAYRAQKSNIVTLYLLSDKGQILSEKKISSTSRLEFYFIGADLQIPYDTYLEVFNNKGNKKFTFTWTSNEYLRLYPAKEGVYIGEFSTSKNGTLAYEKCVGIGQDGKIKWTISSSKNQKNDGLRVWNGNYSYVIYDKDFKVVQLNAIDPLTGKVTGSYKPQKEYLDLPYEGRYIDNHYMTLPDSRITEGHYDSIYPVVDSANMKVLFYAESTFDLFPQEFRKGTGMWPAGSSIYLKIDNRIRLIQWDNYKIASFEWKN